ncbi:hypothetical protein GCM10027416_18940 [Okibacterium endophyticum]
MASVYRARDEVLDRDVALKVFRSDATDAEQLLRQQAEVRMLAALNHPGLAMLIDAGVDDQPDGPPHAFVVMQLIDGSDLRSRLEDGPLAPPEVAQIGADLADALHHIHSHGIVHRDIKPANILMAHAVGADTRMHPKLTDFGIARLVDSTRLTATGTTIGTANYLSPEQAKGEHVGPPSDVYSLGLVLLECLTGEQAFPGPAVESAIARVLAEPPIPEDVGPRWTETIRSLTAKNPEDRPTAHEVAMALRTDPQAMAASSADEAKTVAFAAHTQADAPTVATELLSHIENDENDGSGAQATPEEPKNESKPARKPNWGIRIGLIAAVLLIAAIVTMILTGFPRGGEVVEPPQYPAVPGQIGEDLKEIQESVEQ